jgi:hypothetical protein
MVDNEVAGHRVWDPPDPIPNSEVKPCSVSGASVVFGHVNPGKLAITYISFLRHQNNALIFCNFYSTLNNFHFTLRRLNILWRIYLGNTQNLLLTLLISEKK